MLKFIGLLSRLAPCYELTAVPSTDRFFESVWFYFVFVEFMYIVLLNVELALADIAAVLASRIVRICLNFMRR